MGLNVNEGADSVEWRVAALTLSLTLTLALTQAPALAPQNLLLVSLCLLSSVKGAVPGGAGAA